MRRSEGRYRAALLDRCWSIYLSLTRAFILSENFHVEFPVEVESALIAGALHVSIPMTGNRDGLMGRLMGTLLTSWTKFSSGSSKPRRSRFPLGERPRRPLLRNSPRARKLSSFSPKATGPDGCRFGVPLAILRSSCILQPPHAPRNDFLFSLHVATVLVHPPL